MVAKEDLPSFLPVPDDPDNESILLDSRFDQETTIDSIISVSNIKRTDYEYYTSIVKVLYSNFKNNFAFGCGFSGPNGGAIFTYMSQITIQTSTFEKNYAAMGGALYCLGTQALINDKSLFRSNIAYLSGGAISVNGLKANIIFFNVYNTSFTKNIAKNSGGALHISDSVDSYFQDCLFYQNSASEVGAALDISSSPCYLFNCSIIENNAGDYTPIDPAKKYFPSKITYNLPFGRGCGGIHAVSDQNNKDYTLTVDNCTFVNNYHINSAHNVSISSQRGADIMSYSMKLSILFSNFTSKYENSVYHDNALGLISIRCNFETKQFSPYYYFDSPINFTNHTNSPLSSTTKPYSPVTYGSTTDIPSPTGYTYQATPITKNPINLSTALNINYPSFASHLSLSRIPSHSVTPTLAPTPSRSLSPSPSRSPPSTPSSTPSSSPSRSPSPPPTRSPPSTPASTPEATISGKTKVLTASTVIVNTFINTSSTTAVITKTLTSTITESESVVENEKVNVESTYIYETETTITTIRYIMINTEIVSETSVIIIIDLDEEPTDNTQSSMTAGRLILLATIGIAVVFALAVIGLTLYRRVTKDTTPDSYYSSDETSESSYMEMFQTRENPTIIKFDDQDDNDMLSQFRSAANNDDAGHESEDEDEFYMIYLYLFVICLLLFK